MDHISKERAATLRDGDRVTLRLKNIPAIVLATETDGQLVRVSLVDGRVLTVRYDQIAAVAR